MQSQLFRIITITSALWIVPICAQAASGDPTTSPDPSALLNLSLQQLSDIDVTSVSKTSEKASQAAAALYVITQEDIRRSGLQSIPELLRMVPGLQVAQSGSQNWAITSRGFDGQFANKLLVLIDGRTVYNSVFSGVFWDLQNVMLEDIERIEVIRGPGATLWGANAVNGVINIITKNAKDTQGNLVTAATGNQELGAVAARHGGQDGDLSYRTYGQFFDYAQEHTAANNSSGVRQGLGADDNWDNGQGGFRMDWNTSDKEQQTIQGDAYAGTEHNMRFLPVTSNVSPALLSEVMDTDQVTGMNILGRLKHEINTGSDITLQAYYDDMDKNFQDVGFDLRTQTFDLDFQHNLAVGDRNNITWGLGYRRINTSLGDSSYIDFTPDTYYNNLYSSFIQDKIALLQDELYFTVGTKLEHNDFSGFEWEPSARLAWTPTQNQTLWTAVSRAVRTPDQGDQDINLVVAAVPSGLPAGYPQNALVSQQGLQTTVAEVVTAYEVGYRIQPRSNISIDLTGFVNEYKNKDSFTDGNPSVAYDPTQGYYIAQPELDQNNDRAETHGFELASTWEATKSIKISGGYTLYYQQVHSSGTTLTPSDTSPNQQFNARSYVDLPYNLQWDTMLYYVDTLPTVSDGFGNTIAIPAYTRLDMRLGYTPLQNLDLSLIGQNLLHSEHEEYSPFLYQTPEEIGRSVLAKATLKF